MKTVSVRIGTDQASQLQELVDRLPGASISGVVQRAVKLWLEVEKPVYLAALEKVQGKLAQSNRAIPGRRSTKRETAQK